MASRSASSVSHSPRAVRSSTEAAMSLPLLATTAARRASSCAKPMPRSSATAEAAASASVESASFLFLSASPVLSLSSGAEGSAAAGGCASVASATGSAGVAVGTALAKAKAVAVRSASRVCFCCLTRASAVCTKLTMSWKSSAGSPCVRAKAAATVFASAPDCHAMVSRRPSATSTGKESVESESAGTVANGHASGVGVLARGGGVTGSAGSAVAAAAMVARAAASAAGSVEAVTAELTMSESTRPSERRPSCSSSSLSLSWSSCEPWSSSDGAAGAPSRLDGSAEGGVDGSTTVTLTQMRWPNRLPRGVVRRQ
mmetsp:Transcript_25645/g.59359  ORF Transcript_25645/g.59359 Transcript_25645/m.59359 type:complete len:315 (-) Transcript_25645:1301-2245(-)